VRRKTGSVWFVAATIILVLVAALSFGGTVMSRTDFDAVELESFYRAKESELVTEVREFLAESGLENSGVTLTRVVEQDGSRNYTLTVHHGEIHKMSEQEKENLKVKLDTLCFEDEACTFTPQFL